MKIQIIGRKVCLRYKGKTLLGLVNKLLNTKSLLFVVNKLLSTKSLLFVVNKLLNTKSLLTTPSNVLPLNLKQTFPPIIWTLKGKVMGLNTGYLLKYFILSFINALNPLYLQERCIVHPHTTHFEDNHFSRHRSYLHHKEKSIKRVHIIQFRIDNSY